MFESQFTVTPYLPRFVSYVPTIDSTDIPQPIQPTIISTDFPTAFPTYDPAVFTTNAPSTPSPSFFSPVSDNDFVTDFPTAMPTVIPIALTTSDFPTAKYITTKPTQNPIIIHAEPTPHRQYQFETCVASTSMVNDVSIMIAKSTTHSETMKIVLSGPRDQWFGFGFGGIDNKMQDSYALTVEGRNGDVFERRLGSSASLNKLGTIVSPNSYSSNHIFIAEIGSMRYVTIIRPWNEANTFDFSPFFQCDLHSINVISAVGHSVTVDHHKMSGAIDVLNQCKCAISQPQPITTAFPTAFPTNIPTVIPVQLSANTATISVQNSSQPITTDFPTAFPTTDPISNTEVSDCVDFATQPCNCWTEEFLCTTAIIEGERTDCRWLSILNTCASIVTTPNPTINAPTVESRNLTDFPTAFPTVFPSAEPTEYPSFEPTTRTHSNMSCDLDKILWISQTPLEFNTHSIQQRMFSDWVTDIYESNVNGNILNFTFIQWSDDLNMKYLFDTHNGTYPSMQWITDTILSATHMNKHNLSSTAIRSNIDQYLYAHFGSYYTRQKYKNIIFAPLIFDALHSSMDYVLENEINLLLVLTFYSLANVTNPCLTAFENVNFPKIYFNQLLSQISEINSDSSVHSNIEIVLVHSTVSETNPNLSLFSCLFETDTNVTSQFLTENEINFLTLRDSLSDYVCHSETDMPTLLPTRMPTTIANNGHCAENSYEINYLYKETFSDVLHCYRYNISVMSDAAHININEWNVYLPKYCDHTQIEGANKYFWDCSPNCESVETENVFKLVFKNEINFVNQSMEFEMCLFVIDSLIENEHNNALVINNHSFCDIPIPNICEIETQMPTLPPSVIFVNECLVSDTNWNIILFDTYSMKIIDKSKYEKTNYLYSENGYGNSKNNKQRFLYQRGNDHRRKQSYVDSMCFVYRLYNYNKQSNQCFGNPSNIKYWILSIADCQSIDLIQKLTSANPSKSHNFNVIIRDEMSGLSGYRWKNALPNIGQYQDYTVCVKGNNIETITSNAAIVGMNGYHTKDIDVQIPMIC